MDQQKTSALARGLLAIITVFFAAASLKVVTWAMYQGREGMKFFLWVAVFGTAIAGYALTAIRGDIKLRLHRFWTPAGIAMMVWVCYFMVLIAAPRSTTLWDLLHNQSAETYLFAISLGLLVAFVEPKTLYRYAYYFVPLAVFFIVFQLIDLVITLPMVLIQRGLSWTTQQIYEMNDIFVLLSSPLYLYYAAKRIRVERPTLRSAAKSLAPWVAFFVVLMLVNSILTPMLPPSNGLFQWLRA